MEAVKTVIGAATLVLLPFLAVTAVFEPRVFVPATILSALIVLWACN